MIKYLIENKEWIFSGIGVLIVVKIIEMISKKRRNSKKNYLESNEVNAEGDIHIGDNLINEEENIHKKNIVKNNTISTKGNFHLGDKDS